MTFEQAEAECRAMGFTPFRLAYREPIRYREWEGAGVSFGQVQSSETWGPATYNHPKYCVEVTEK